MKTLFFCNLIPLKTGAFEAVLAAIGAEFTRAGDTFVLVLGGEPIAPVADALRAAGVRWQVLPGWAAGPGQEHAWRFVRPAAALVRQERPDVAVVHFGNELPTLAAAVLARLAGGKQPRWVWQQDQQIRDPGRIGRHLSRIRLLAAGGCHFVAVYEGGRQSLIRRGIRADRMAVIYNSIAAYTPRRVQGWLREELGIGADEVILVTTGSLIPRKRIDFLLSACATLDTLPIQHPRIPATGFRPCEGTAAGTAALHAPRGWRLLVLGEGPLRESLVAQARTLGIAERVHFLGLRNDVREVLAEADVLVHASLAETCTYAITESMAAGIPAVVTEAGAAREQIVDGVSGYVLDRDDQAGFAVRLARLVGDPAARAAMGQAAQARWSERYRLDRAAAQFHQLYASLARR